MQHPDRGDPGAVEIGYYSVDGRDLTMTEENGKRVDPNVEKSVPIADLRAVYARHDADLRAVAERTGAKLLDVFPDVCGNGETCSAFFGAREPKFTDGVHLRPVFVREHLHFLDFLLM